MGEETVSTTLDNTDGPLGIAPTTVNWERITNTIMQLKARRPAKQQAMAKDNIIIKILPSTQTKSLTS